MSSIETALTAIGRYHFGQTDKGGQPYVLHLLDVMHIVKTKYKLFYSYTEEQDILCVALLHDILEDTQATYEDLINAGFSPDVVDAVKILTKTTDTIPNYIKGIRQHRWANIVKLADLENNLEMFRLDKFLNEKDMARVNGYLSMHRQLELTLRKI